MNPTEDLITKYDNTCHMTSWCKPGWKTTLCLFEHATESLRCESNSNPRCSGPSKSQYMLVRDRNSASDIDRDGSLRTIRPSSLLLLLGRLWRLRRRLFRLTAGIRCLGCFLLLFAWLLGRLRRRRGCGPSACLTEWSLLVPGTRSLQCLAAHCGRPGRRNLVIHPFCAKLFRNLTSFFPTLLCLLSVLHLTKQLVLETVQVGPLMLRTPRLMSGDFLPAETTLLARVCCCLAFAWCHLARRPAWTARAFPAFVFWLCRLCRGNQGTFVWMSLWRPLTAPVSMARRSLFFLLFLVFFLTAMRPWGTAAPARRLAKGRPCCRNLLLRDFLRDLLHWCRRRTLGAWRRRRRLRTAPRRWWGHDLSGVRHPMQHTSIHVSSKKFRHVRVENPWLTPMYKYQQVKKHPEIYIRKDRCRATAASQPRECCHVGYITLSMWERHICST